MAICKNAFVAGDAWFSLITAKAILRLTGGLRGFTISGCGCRGIYCTKSAGAVIVGTLFLNELLSTVTFIGGILIFGEYLLRIKNNIKIGQIRGLF
ncbi:hypothetical protein OOC_11381 [Providencia rettgeri Dmel1]|nr:hypothetical protein OOC_11381 [Providencia rettgeri Dmel1]